jgi:hypothetical protein
MVEEAAVNVEREAWGGMSELPADEDDVQALRDQERAKVWRRSWKRSRGLPAWSRPARVTAAARPRRVTLRKYIGAPVSGEHRVVGAAGGGGKLVLSQKADE